jgi:hypothetical protein
MSSSDDARQQSAERARALLAVLDIQPPPDFAVQVLARVYALQAARVPHPVTYARLLPSQQPSRGWRKACGHVRRRSRVPGQKIMACGLVVASAVLLWCVSTRLLPTPLPEGARQAYTALQPDTVPIGDHLDGAGRSAAALQEEVAAAEPVPQPSKLAPQSREVQIDEGDLAREGEHAVRPKAPMTPGLPVSSREAPKLSARAQEQQSGRHRGLRGKAKRSGKGLRLSRHVPA